MYWGGGGWGGRYNGRNKDWIRKRGKGRGKREERGKGGGGKKGKGLWSGKGMVLGGG